MPTIQIPTPLRQHTGGKDAVTVAGSTVNEALADLGRQYPELTGRLMEGGEVRRFVNIYVKDEDIRYLQNLDTPLADGDVIAIIPAVAGG